MSTVSAQGRHRPDPIRLNLPDLNTRSLLTRMAFKSPAWAPSPLSPMSRPSPLHPEHGDQRMKDHDKATVDRLEPRSRRSSPNPESALRRVSLRPIAELGLPTPRTATLDRRPPLSAPLLPPPPYRRPTIAEETRNMLLFEPGAEKGIPQHVFERRLSAPSGEALARNMQIQRQREQMRRRALMGSHGPHEADLMVIPVEHRRPSTLAPPDQEGRNSPLIQGNKLNLRVVVHSHGRKPVVLTRNFNLDELRATIPDASSSPRVQASRRASLAVLQTPMAVARPPSPAFISGRRHSSGAIHSVDSARPTPTERRGSRQESHAVPIRKSTDILNPPLSGEPCLHLTLFSTKESY